MGHIPMTETTTRHTNGGDYMNDDLIELLKVIESMNTISKVEIVVDDVKILVEKSDSFDNTPNNPVPNPVFKKMKLNNKETSNENTDLASPGQLKFARDLMGKMFGNDERGGLDFLAHTLEIPLNDVPEMANWETEMTRDMVGSILDALDGMYKKRRNSQ